MSMQWDPKKDSGNAKKHEGVRFAEKADVTESDDLQAHYDFDYSKAKPNRFAECIHQEGIRGIRYIFGLFLVVSLIGIDIHALKACEPYPQPWFVANFRWDENSLPEGIELREYEDYLFVNNTTAQMAWIIDGSQQDALIIAQETDFIGDTSAGLDELVQILVSQEKKGINIPSNPRGSILIGSSMSELSGGHPESMMFAQTKRTVTKPPPPNVEIPNGKVFNLVLVHHQEIYPIRVTMVYSINTKFDENPCGYEPRDTNPIPWIMLFAVVIVGAGLYLWSTES